MTAYYIMTIVLFVLSLLELMNLRRSNANVLRGMMIVYLVCFIGLRYNTGSDWHMYTTMFDIMPEQGNVMNWEYGFYLVSLLFHKIFGNYYVLQCAATLFIFLCADKMYRENSEHPILMLSVFTFFFFSSLLMAQVRQSIAVAVIMLGTKYIFERKLIKYAIVIAVACLFHTSAIVALPLFFLNKNYGKALPIILLLISQSLYFFPNIIPYFIKFLIPYMPERFANISNTYISSSFFSNKVNFGTGYYYIANVLLTLFIIIYNDRSKKEEIFFTNALAIAMTIKAISNGFYVLERFYAYYMIYGLISYNFLLKIKIGDKVRQSQKIIFGLILLVFIYIPLFKAINNTEIFVLSGREGNYTYVPYYNVISHPQEADLRKDWNEQ